MGTKEGPTPQGWPQLSGWSLQVHRALAGIVGWSRAPCKVVNRHIPVVKAAGAASDGGEGNTEGEMMIRVVMFSAIFSQRRVCQRQRKRGTTGGD